MAKDVNGREVVRRNQMNAKIAEMQRTSGISLEQMFRKQSYGYNKYPQDYSQNNGGGGWNGGRQVGHNPMGHGFF